MKICLVNPGKTYNPTPPLGLGYLTSYLKKYGKHSYDIIIADENVGQNVKKIITNFNHY